MNRFKLSLGVSFVATMFSICSNSPIVSAASLGPVLTSISVTQGTATRLLLAFSPATPLYRISSQDRKTYSIVLPDVAQSASIATHTAGAGLLSSIDVATHGRDTIIQAHADSASGLVVTRLPTLLELDFTADVHPSEQLQKLSRSTPPPSSSGQVSSTLVLRLKYADLSEVAQILTGQAINELSDQPVASSVLSQSAPIIGVNGGGYSGNLPAQSTFNSQIQPVPTGPLLGSQRINEHVAIDRRLNAVVLSGTAIEVAQLRSLIEQLDIPDAPSISILLETEIVELTENAARKIGLDIANNGAAVSASIESRSLNPTQSQLNIQAQLFLQLSNGGGKLLAKPRVQTANGMAASILTGDAIPILTTITYPGSPPTIQQQLQYANVGVHLQVQPFASSSGIVTTRVLAEVSNVTGFIQGNIPQISQRQAITVARVRDGQSFIVGGLLQDNEIKAMSKIPIIGDLPILGSLFRTNQLTKQKTNLYIILTPHIVSTDAAL